MQAKILAVHDAPPSNGQWQAVAVIDVELLVNLVPVVIRGITVRTKASEGKIFFGMRSMKRGEDWVQVIDLPEHQRQLQDALLAMWLAYTTNPSIATEPDHDTAPLAPEAPRMEQPTRGASVNKPRPNPALLDQCPF